MKKTFLQIGIVVVLIAIIILGALLVLAKTQKVKNPIATIQIEGYEKPIIIELDPEAAPNAVANFIKLANNGFYNNYKMIINEKEISASESMSMATLSNIMEYPQNDYVYGIKGEFLQNGVENLLKHDKGVITMKRDSDWYYSYIDAEGWYNSANSNFAILTEDVDNYNGNYAAFGRVKEGIDVVNAIAATRVEVKKEETTTENTDKTETTEESKEPQENIIVIKSITVDTFGVDYGIPEYVNYEEYDKNVQTLYKQYFGNSNIVTE